MRRRRTFVVGDKVEVLDTSNGKTLKGWVRKKHGENTTVYVERFGNEMTFNGTMTRLGRFKLQGILVRPGDGRR